MSNGKSIGGIRARSHRCISDGRPTAAGSETSKRPGFSFRRENVPLAEVVKNKSPVLSVAEQAEQKLDVSHVFHETRHGFQSRRFSCL